MTKVHSKEVKFARFGGGLSSVIQEGYSAEAKTYHSPPAGRGIFAFVWPYYEFFLISAELTTKKFPRAKNKKGEVITEFDYPEEGEGVKGITKSQHIWQVFVPPYPRIKDEQSREEHDKIVEEWEKTRKEKYITRPRPKIFYYEGELWSHFTSTIPNKYITGIHGDWVKSCFEGYCEGLRKTIHGDKSTPMDKGWKAYWGAKCGRYSMDHLEVFIEKV